MTLIEILVVLAIIGLIMGGVAVVATNAFGGAQQDTAKKDIENLVSSVEMYRMQKKNQCPKSVQDLVDAGIVRKVTKDPWDSDYVIKCEGSDIKISSPGEDTELGTEDDINSWDDPNAKKDDEDK